MKILSRDGLVNTLKNNPNQYDCVMICEIPSDNEERKELEINKTLVRKYSRSYFISEFNDIKTYSPELSYLTSNREKSIDLIKSKSWGNPPTIIHIESILNWAKDKNPLVACYAGVSRSSATSILIRLARKESFAGKQLSPKEVILDMIKEGILKPQIHRPNQVILSIGESLLGIPGIRDASNSIFKQW